jgi:hypothetical protein
MKRLRYYMLLLLIRWTTLFHRNKEVDFDKEVTQSTLKVIGTCHPFLVNSIPVDQVPAKDVLLCATENVAEYLEYIEQMLNFIHRSDDIPSTLIHDYLMSRREIPFRTFMGGCTDLYTVLSRIQELTEKMRRMIESSPEELQYHYSTRLHPVNQDALMIVLTIRDLSTRSDIHV